VIVLVLLSFGIIAISIVARNEKGVSVCRRKKVEERKARKKRG
jgi:hypothetical protein